MGKKTYNYVITRHDYPYETNELEEMGIVISVGVELEAAKAHEVIKRLKEDYFKKYKHRYGNDWDRYRLESMWGYRRVYGPVLYTEGGNDT